MAQKIWPGNSNPNIPTIPDKWDKEWFRKFITNHMLPADPRNMTVTGGLELLQATNPRQPPTLTVTGGAAPGNEPYLLQQPPSSSSLTKYRVLAVDGTVFHLQDGGAAGSLTLQTATGGFPNTALALMPAHSLKGNASGGVAAPTDLDVATVNTILPIFTSSLNGIVPASGGGTQHFLRADGQFATPVLAAIKSGDTTKANNTLANDADLQITILETGTYTFEIFLAFYQAVGGTAGFQFDLNGGAATIGSILFGTTGFSNAAVSLIGATAANTAQAFATIQTSASTPSWCAATGTVTFSAVGTFILRWAQNTTSANVTTLKALSSMQLTKVA